MVRIGCVIFPRTSSSGTQFEKSFLNPFVCFWPTTLFTLRPADPFVSPNTLLRLEVIILGKAQDPQLMFTSQKASCLGPPCWTNSQTMPELTFSPNLCPCTTRLVVWIMLITAYFRSKIFQLNWQWMWSLSRGKLQIKDVNLRPSHSLSSSDLFSDMLIEQCSMHRWAHQWVSHVKDSRSNSSKLCPIQLDELLRHSIFPFRFHINQRPTMISVHITKGPRSMFTVQYSV